VAGLILEASLGARLEECSEPPPHGLAPAVSAQLPRASLTVADAGAAWLTLWLVAVPTPAAIERPDVVAGLAPGALAGALRVERTWRDFRDRSIPRGVYTLRYAVRPILKEHAGVSPYRDFLVLVPAHEDDGSASPQERWIAASRGIAAAAHPAVLALFPAARPGPELEESAAGDLVLVPPNRTIALVLKGHGLLGGF